MRAVVQRVKKARVMVDDAVAGEIEKGLVVLLGIGMEDGDNDIEYMADKIVNLRIFEDENGKMNISVRDVNGSILVVSQFTLFGDARKGKRPSFDKAARPEFAREVYEKFIERCKAYGIRVEKGIFQASMVVEIHNEGPVTILLDSKKEF